MKREVKSSRIIIIILLLLGFFCIDIFSVIVFILILNLDLGVPQQQSCDPRAGPSPA